MGSGQYVSNLTDEQWSIVRPLLPEPNRRGRRQRINLHAVLDAIFHLLRAGCQWRQLPCDFPYWSTVYWYFRSWRQGGAWIRLQRELYRLTRLRAGRAECPTVVIMDGHSVKTTEVGGTRGSDAVKRVKGRKRHNLVGTLGLPIANRVEAADVSDRRAGALLTTGLDALSPAITTVIADATRAGKRLDP